MADTTTVTTPTGLVIEFTEYPRGYTVQGEAVPSVTTILRILDKPALRWWSMTKGIDAVVELAEMYGWKEEGLPDNFSDPKRVLEWVKREKLTVNDYSKKAGTRGQAAHTALERFVRDGEVPDEREFPVPDRGFVKALKAWCEDYQPQLEMAEVMVGSVEHGYAGRFDLLARCNGSLYLLDLKTSATPRVYDEALIQLAGYEACLEECGYPLPDKKAVVCVAANGKYVVKESVAQPQHFLCILAAFRAVDEVKLIHTEAKAA